MTGLVRADLIYSDLRRRADGRMEARGPEGWQIALPGDALDFGRGVVVSIDGGDQIAGGSVKASVGAVVIGFAALLVCAVLGIGKGVGS